MTIDEIVRIVENLAREGPEKSVSASVHISQPRAMGINRGNSNSGELDLRFNETSNGLRYFEERQTWGDGKTFRDEAFSDGKRCAEVSYLPGEVRQKQIVIKKTFDFESKFGYRHIPVPFRFIWYAGTVPLRQALLSAEKRPDSTVGDRPCDVFHFRSIGPTQSKQSLVYYLDKSTSAVLRVSAYDNPAHIDADLPNWTWLALATESIQGRHVPMKSTYTGFSYSKGKGDGNRPEVNIVQTVEVREISFDQPMPRALFWPVYQPGVEVVDTLTNPYKIHTVPGGPPPVVEKGQLLEPVRVAEESGNGSTIAIGLGLSILVLVVTVILKIRRNR